MKKTGIFYGSSTGNTREVAEMIASQLGVAPADVHDVAETAPSVLGDYDNLILGTATYGSGELQDDWYDFLAGAEQLDLSGKKVALFGCGDENMSDTFCGAVGELHDRMKQTGVEYIGEGYGTDGYEFSESQAVVDGHTVGLLLDCINHDNLTADRVKGWTDIVRLSL